MTEWQKAYGNPAPLDQLTIIIFTRDRFHAVAQQLRQWHGLPTKFLVLVNGSTDVNGVDRVKLTANITYHFLADGYHWQMANASDWIRTPYCMLADDDDILSPHGLRSAVSLLSLDPSIESVAGIRGSLVENSDGISLTTTIPSNENRLGSLYRMRLKEQYLVIPLSNLESSPLDRSVFQLSSPWRGQGWYAVHRTPFMKRALPMLARIDAGVTCRSAAEVAMELITAWQGKIHFLPEITQFRRDRDPSVVSNSSHRWLSYHAWAESKRYEHEFKGYVESLLAFLDVAEPENQQEIEVALRFSARDDWRGKLFNRFYGLLSLRLTPTSMSRMREYTRQLSRRRGQFHQREMGQLLVSTDDATSSSCTDADWIIAFLRDDTNRRIIPQ